MNEFEKKKENFLDVATSVLTQDSSFRAFGNNVSFQLQDMDRRQRVIAEKLISDVLFHGKLGNLKDHSTIVIQEKIQQPNNPTHNNSNFMNRHTQSQPYRSDFYYNRPHIDVHPSYAHNFDGSADFPHQHYSNDPHLYFSQGTTRVSTLPSSVVVTSTLMSTCHPPASTYTHGSDAANALKANTSNSHSTGFGSFSSPASVERSNNPDERLEIGQFLLLPDAGSAEQ